MSDLQRTIANIASHTGSGELPIFDPDAISDHTSVCSYNPSACYILASFVRLYTFQWHVRLGMLLRPVGTVSQRASICDSVCSVGWNTVHLGCVPPGRVAFYIHIEGFLQSKFADLREEYMKTHLTAEEGKALHMFLKDALETAVSNLPTPSASEVSFGGNTENEEFHGQEQEADGCGATVSWTDKFGEQHRYADAVLQNLRGLIDQEQRFLKCMVDLVMCQV